MVRAQRTYEWIDPRGLATLIRHVIWAQLIMLLVIALQPLLSLLLTWRLFDPNAETFDSNQFNTIARIDSVIGLVNPLYMLTAAFGVYLAGRWVFAAVRNAHRFDPSMPYGPWGAVLWHIVPGANLVFPHNALVKTWKVSGGGREESGRWWLITLWWLTFWGAITFSFSVQFIPTPYSPDVARSTLFFYVIGLPMASAVLTGLSALLFLRVVDRLTRMQLHTHTLGIFQADDAAPGQGGGR